MVRVVARQQFIICQAYGHCCYIESKVVSPG